ncbi:MAG: FeoA family protein [Desulfobacteraceae bacterium]|jgi:ferrous iron transport protein A
MELTISDLELDASARITGYSKDAKLFKSRLLSMGLTRGTELKVVRVAPLGDPIEINIRGFNLSLRKTEAEAVLVERS